MTPDPRPDAFRVRHIGPRDDELDEMVAEVEAASLDVLIDEAIPEGIRLDHPLDLPPAETESACLTALRALLAGMPRIARSSGSATTTPLPQA